MESLPLELGVYLFSHTFFSLEEQQLLSRTTPLFRHWIQSQQVLIVPESKVGTPSLLEAIPDVREIRGYLRASSLTEAEEMTKDLLGSVRIVLPLDSQMDLEKFGELVGDACQFVRSRSLRCNSSTGVAFQVPHRSDNILPLIPNIKLSRFPYRISWSPRTRHKTLRLPPSVLFDARGSTYKWVNPEWVNSMLSFIRDLPLQKLTIDIHSGHKTVDWGQQLFSGLRIPLLETTLRMVVCILHTSLAWRLHGAHFERIECFPEIPLPRTSRHEEVDKVPNMIPLILGHQPLHGSPTPLPFGSITGLYLSPVKFLHSLGLMETVDFHRYFDRLVQVAPHSIPGLVFYRSSGDHLQRFPTTSDGSRTDLAVSQEWIATLSQFDQQIIRELHEKYPDFSFHLYLI